MRQAKHRGQRSIAQRLSKTGKASVVFQSNQLGVKALQAEVTLMARLWPFCSGGLHRSQTPDSHMAEISESGSGWLINISPRLTKGQQLCQSFSKL